MRKPVHIHFHGHTGRYAPWFHDLFDTASLRPQDWILVLAMGLGTFLIIEMDKAIERFLAARNGKPDF